MMDNSQRQPVRRIDLTMTNSLADWSLGLGVIVLFYAVLCIPIDSSMSIWPPRENRPWRELFSFVLLALPGIILGLVAIVKGRRTSLRREIRRGTVGLVLGMLTLAAAGAAALGYEHELHQYEQHSRHLALLQVLASEAETYCRCNGDRFPPAAHWNDAMGSIFVQGSESNSLDHPALAMNRKLGGFLRGKIRGRDKTVLFFDSRPGKNLNGGPELLAYENGMTTVVFVDGSIQHVTPREAHKLKWKP